MSDEQTPAPPPAGLDLCLTLEEFPVRITDRNGVTKDYKLVELTGLERDKWLNTMAARVKMSGDGKPQGISSFDDMQANLITKCLFDAEGKTVPVAMIRGWPAKVQQALFKKIEDMNGLSDAGKEEAKKN